MLKYFQENDFWKDPSYSTEDLLLLWQFEKNFLKKELLQQRSRNETNLNKIINSYLKYLDYDMYVEKLVMGQGPSLARARPGAQGFWRALGLTFGKGPKPGPGPGPCSKARGLLRAFKM